MILVIFESVIFLEGGGRLAVGALHELVFSLVLVLRTREMANDGGVGFFFVVQRMDVYSE